MWWYPDISIDNASTSMAHISLPVHANHPASSAATIYIHPRTFDSTIQITSFLFTKMRPAETFCDASF